MTDTDLNEVLNRATVPERGADYWERFPIGVTAEIERRTRSAPIPSGARDPWWRTDALRFVGRKVALVVGAAAVCLALGFFLGLWRGQAPHADDQQLAAVRKYFREIQALFPNQLQAIVFDQHGAHFVLAREPNLPASPPIYLSVSGPKGCQRFVTFSGQQIRINGDVCEVLADGRGGVLLVGRKLLWAGSQSRGRTGRFQVEAKPLDATL
jgi:hypothetical protein